MSTTITVTEYIPPHGKTREIQLKLPIELKPQIDEILAAGGNFTQEYLRTMNQFVVYVSHEGESVDLDLGFSRSTKGIVDAFSALIKYGHWKKVLARFKDTY